MGREQREDRSEVVRIHWLLQRILGTDEDGNIRVHPARVYDTKGCPKCGQASFAKQWHLGQTMEVARDPDACKVRGEHMHGTCQVCGFIWLEETVDHDEREEREREAAEAEA